MKFDVPQATITLDGHFPEWQCAEVKAQTPFYPFNNKGDRTGSHCCGDKLTMFDDYNGKVAWDPADQSVAISFAWDPQHFYIGVKVILSLSLSFSLSLSLSLSLSPLSLSLSVHSF